MSWPDALDGFKGVLQPLLPDCLIDVGTWGVVPNVDAVKIFYKGESWGDFYDRPVDICIDVFIVVEPQDDYSTAYQKLWALQSLICTTAHGFFPTQTGINGVKFHRWEGDGGVFYPTLGARLTMTLMQKCECGGF